MQRKDFNRFDRFVRRMRSTQARRHTRAGDRVIDVGCGQNNWLIRSMGSWAPDSLGIDPNLRPEYQDDQATTQTLEQIAAVPGRQFDTALSLAVIEHLERSDAPQHLATIRQVLQPAGRLVLTTPSPRSKPVLEFLSFRLGLISRDEIADHRHYYSLDEVRQLVESTGFEVLKAKTFHLGLNQIVVARRRSSGPTRDVDAQLDTEQVGNVTFRQQQP